MLHSVSQKLSKISNQKNESFVTTAHFHRSSRNLLVQKEIRKAERNLKVDLEVSEGNYDYVFEEAEEIRPSALTS